MPENPSVPSRPKVPRQLLVAGGVLVTVVTAATIAIPLIADANRRDTSAGTLTVETDEPIASAALASVGVELADGFNPYDQTGDGVTDVWAIPLEAFDSMPIDGDGCTPERLAWLAENNLQDSVPPAVTLRNDATDGQAMTVDEIRFDGERTSESTRVVAVQCAGYGGDAGLQFVDVPLAGGSAVYGEPPWGDSTTGVAPAGSPVVLNLSPGELVQLMLYANRDGFTGGFSGSIVADVTVGDARETVTLADGLSFYTLEYMDTFYLYGPTIGCDQGDCSPAQANELIAGYRTR
ncbi:hypothetical protein [Protaetiibacter mangrovi]|uniref:Uncharacterized protein n=1 Tax=Protaetiibacter mangrovi TaxID=2970926 RepID=A0ABT1ZDH5_9MICO|nr:hypothetical protein [Protaetiibacter mangrovi]MCS0498740.1 hypothetical protein [Protaetiibacter mangrovi]TPX03424.1 hypothetical protein FJ656_17265 [Schumannella luteola]